uniref:Putative secreted protein n=1 Tax=Rhipicephalus microplus TaxID=6941 RepID=A0A6G5A2W8_RHIMP
MFSAHNTYCQQTFISQSLISLLLLYITRTYTNSISRAFRAGLSSNKLKIQHQPSTRLNSFCVCLLIIYHFNSM